MLWYILIIAAILATLAIYVKMKTAKRLSDPSSLSEVDRALANETAVVSAACVVLAVIVLFVLGSQPGAKKLKEIRLQDETGWRRLIGRRLGQEIEQVVEPPVKILVVDQAFGRNDKAYHQAYIQGLQEGITNPGVLIGKEVFVKAPSGDITTESERSQLVITNEALDKWVADNPECTVVISFVGLPLDYGSSDSYINAVNGRLQVGAFCNSVYTLGAPLASKGLHVCIVPKRGYVKDLPGEVEPDDEDAFDNRYLLVTPANVVEVYKSNRRMFKVAKLMR